MKRAVYSVMLPNGLRPVHGAILLIPLLFCGCFDSQSKRTQAAQGKGIETLSRFFSRTQAPAQADTAPTSDSAYMPFMPRGITASPEFAEEVANLAIALPGFLDNTRSANGAWRHVGASGRKSPAAARRGGTINPEDLTILNSSFSQLFSSVFNHGGSNEIALKEELPNPFTEERVKREASPGKQTAEPSENKSSAANSDKSDAKAAENSAPPATPDPAVQATAGAGVRWEKDFLILGDFDGSGKLSARSAQRSGEASFISDDGERGFNLYVNYSALNHQSSFYIDDINGDGISDLLITTSSSVFGGVLLGDGSGGYRIADKFVTGYEPTIPSAGPFRGGMREILTVNPRTGMLKRYVSGDQYQSVQIEILSLLPDFLLHLVESAASRDFVMAGQVGGAEQILGWNENNLLQSTGSSLGADPAVLSGSFGVYSLQVYQVGNYASVVLSGQDKLFNVANLRVTPQTFLVLGDIYRQGFVDVGVGSVTSFTPSK